MFVETLELFISMYIQILILHTILRDIKTESFFRRMHTLQACFGHAVNSWRLVACAR